MIDGYGYCYCYLDRLCLFVSAAICAAHSSCPWRRVYRLAGGPLFTAEEPPPGLQLPGVCPSQSLDHLISTVLRTPHYCLVAYAVSRHTSLQLSEAVQVFPVVLLACHKCYESGMNCKVMVDGIQRPVGASCFIRSAGPWGIRRPAGWHGSAQLKDLGDSSRAWPWPNVQLSDSSICDR